MDAAEVVSAPSGRRSWRSVIFRFVAGVSALLFLAIGALSGLLVPWFPALAPDNPAIQRPDIHYWHDAEFGALVAILLVGSLLALAWRPHEQPLLLQFVALWGAIVVIAVAPFGPGVFVFLIPIGLVLLTYPAARRLLDLPRPNRGSRSLLALTAASAILLAIPTWNAFQLQLNDPSEHATANHWIIAVVLGFALVGAGLLAASRRPGWLALGIITGAAFVYLGLAALTLPNQDGTWGVTGGALALLGGAAYIGATLLEASRSRLAPSTKNLATD
jgi:MFS family permease